MRTMYMTVMPSKSWSRRIYENVSRKKVKIEEDRLRIRPKFLIK